LKLGYLYKDLYEMTVKELDDTLKYRKEGLGYTMWRMGTVEATAIGCCFSKNAKYPRKPQEMLEELYPTPKGIPMPDFLKKKYYERKGVKM
jgi:hypothetical protein